jgi:predicted nucleic acid-binding Zn ribbon protein
MKKASELIDQIFQSLKIEDHGDTISLFQQWEKIAGSDIASHSHIHELEKQTLIIVADHPAYLQLLQMKKRTILGRIRKEYPELGIEKIHAILGRSGLTK